MARIPGIAPFILYDLKSARVGAFHPASGIAGIIYSRPIFEIESARRLKCQGIGSLEHLPVESIYPEAVVREITGYQFNRRPVSLHRFVLEINPAGVPGPIFAKGFETRGIRPGHRTFAVKHQTIVHRGLPMVIT
jgi:hypothetical protein